MNNNHETKCNACVAMCSCGWRSSPYFFVDEGNEDCAKVSAIIETRLGHLAKNAAENGNGKNHLVTYEKVVVESS